MKDKDYVHYVIEAVLAIAVVILFVLNFSGNKSSSGKNAAAVSSEGAKGEAMPMAYIDLDSLMVNYMYSIDLNEQITKRFENSRADLTEKARKLQSEINDFQRKYETGSFLTAERAQSEQQRLVKKQEDLQKYEAELSQELAAEQQRMNEDLRKTIIANLRDFNKDKGFQLIYGKRDDNILYSDDVYNVTDEVVEFLNNQYAVSPAAKKEE